MKMKIKIVKDEFLNDYLFYRNKKINRVFSEKKKIISSLEHYLWWFSQNYRKSYKVFFNRELKIIIYIDTFKFKKLNIFFPGYFICDEKVNFFEILKAIKMQNQLIEKVKNKIIIIKVSKKNKFSNLHTKYFSYKRFEKSHKFFEILNKKFEFKLNQLNYYYK